MSENPSTVTASIERPTASGGDHGCSTHQKRAAHPLIPLVPRGAPTGAPCVGEPRYPAPPFLEPEEHMHTETHSTGRP